MRISILTRFYYTLCLQLLFVCLFVCFDHTDDVKIQECNSYPSSFCFNITSYHPNTTNDTTIYSCSDGKEDRLCLNNDLTGPAGDCTSIPGKVSI